MDNKSIKLFVYGTLQIPEIQHALLDYVPLYINGKIDDYRAANLQDRPYPGLVKSHNSVLTGKILDLTTRDFTIIELWEDEKYIRHNFESSRVKVRTADGLIEAFVFIWGDADTVISTNWSLSDFIENHLDRYLLRIPKFLETIPNGKL